MGDYLMSVTSNARKELIRLSRHKHFVVVVKCKKTHGRGGTLFQNFRS